jgi:cytochrome oxidase Cu insertion factor (SCO1/SenC/PrrC family)
MRGPALKYWLVLVCSLAAMYGSLVVARYLRPPVDTGAGPASPDTASQPAGPPLDHFVLTDQAGQLFDSESLRGRVWVASFFFTNCPAVCWRMNQTLAALQQTHPQSAIRFISITCDPDNDTPEALAKYADHFHADAARWTFLTGSLDLIRRIGRDFFTISVEKAGHTDRACVVDRQGQVRGRFRLTEPDQVAMFEKLLSTVEAEADTGPPSPEAVAEPLSKN